MKAAKDDEALRAVMAEREAVIRWLESHAKGHEHGREYEKADVLREKAMQIRRGEHREE